ncbi:MAG: lysophospholipid acyltransferase family protein [Prevotella sp.]|nr:lysophospholipid acyltransferase family protein [Prevotella sp.]
MIKQLSYRLLYGFTYAISLLPFWLLYLLSDGFFLLIYYVVRYRRRIVRNNLATSFPEKDEAELRQISRQFYHWLCDYFVETIKLLSISNGKLLRHIEFRGVEQLEQCFDNGQDCAAILGHYCNWEWLSATGLAFKRYPEAVMGLIYHPLYNDAFDQLFIDIRKAHGGDCIPKQDILRHLITFKRDNRRSLFGYISDQAPRWHNIHLWLPFLNHDTPVFTGGERIMRKMDDAVFYVEMERQHRGHYTCTFKLISPHASQGPDDEITRRFFQMLEETIRRAPSYYLWTHNRWKRTHEEFDRQYVMVNGKAIPREEFKES